MSKKGACQFCLAAMLLLAQTVFGQDAVADNMLLYQRSVGGWPKHINNVKLDYTVNLSAAQKAAVSDDKFRNDATIDNSATVKEVRYLVKAYSKTGNNDYLAAAEKGIRYLLTMQYANGGFPQFFPDTNLYRAQITFNDNAMINALNVLWDVANKRNGLEMVNASLQEPAQKAVENGIDCLLKTQIKREGRLTGWCAQYNHRTLQPEKARAFELVSISGMETVGIVEFLMKVDNPSAPVKAAIEGAVTWLQDVRINGYAFQDVTDTTKPKQKDRVVLADPASVIWARFYDIETQKPFFCGRDGVKKWNVADIEHERRIGYAWYGTWPASVLEKKYPEWKKKQQGS